MFNTEKKSLILLSYSPNPRMNKRMNLLKKQSKVKVVYWDRSGKNIWGDGNIPLDISCCKFPVKLQSSGILERIFKTARFTNFAIKKIKEFSPNLLYVENLDMLFIATIYKKIFNDRVKIIYEVADLSSFLLTRQKNFFKKVIAASLRTLDKILCKNIHLLVITSELFYETYFKNFVEAERKICVLNIPTKEIFQNFKKSDHEKFTIGFIGMIRYKEQMKMLINAIDNLDVKVIFAGNSFDDEIEKICRDNNKVKYYGGYNYQKDIKKLYESMDCIYSVYDADIYNVRIALPNKLYEAAYCKLPIIVAKNTYLGKVVNEKGVGFSVDCHTPEELIQVIKKLKNDSQLYRKIEENCEKYVQEIERINNNEKLLDAFGLG